MGTSPSSNGTAEHTGSTGVVGTDVTVATNNPASPIPVGDRPVGIAIAPARTVPAGPVCGNTGARSGTTRTHHTVGSDTFTVPADVDSVEITVTGAQGGHYFVAGDEAHPSPTPALATKPDQT